MSKKLLQQMVEKLGLQEVSKQIGYTKGAVCHVLKGSYKGNPGRILKATEEKFSQQTVECPVMGEIPLSRCVENRNLPFSSANPIRVILARMCPKCGQRETQSGERGQGG